MRTSLLRFICLSIVLTLCIPMVACDMQFGGLIGELMNQNPDVQEALTNGDIDNVIEDIQTMIPMPDIETDVYTEVTEDITQETLWGTTETEGTVADGFPSEDNVTTEPPVIIDPVIVHSSFDELHSITDEVTSAGDFFIPCQANAWDRIANVANYKVDYLLVWGWNVFYDSTPGIYGYQIDDQTPVFSSDFTIEAEQPIIDIATNLGAKSSSRMKILIPIRDLSGTHTIKAIAKDEAGTIEVIAEFTLNKAVDPYTPVSYIKASDIYSALENGSQSIFDATVRKDGFGNDYVRWTTNHDEADPFVYIRFYQENNYVSQDARFLIIKCRIDSENLTRLSGTVFVGSAMGPVGGIDQVGFDYAQHSDWQLVIIDLAAVDAVDDQFSISYLRLDCYDQTPDESAYFDIAYFATFKTLEDVMQYDQDHPMSKES